MADKQADQHRILLALQKAIMSSTNEIGYPNRPLAEANPNALMGLQDRLQGMVKQIILLRNSIYRLVTTSTISIGFLKPGRTFHPHEMTNAYEEVPGTENEDQTVATIAIGLGTVLPGSGSSESTQWLLKPKIVLENLLDEL
jgi:hypothetical protein